MAEVVWGEDVLLEMLVGGSYYPILCGTDCTYTCAAEFIEKTGPESGGAREWMRRLEEHTSTVSGLTKIDNGTTISFFYMLQLSIRRAAQTFRLTFTDSDGNDFVMQGPGLIGTQEINGPMGDFSRATIEIRWNGVPTMQAILPPDPAVIQDPLYISVVAGATSVSNVLLTQSGVNILEVQREGIGHTETSGTPTNRQFKFDGTAGSISFDTAIPFMAGEVIYILYEL